MVLSVLAAKWVRHRGPRSRKIGECNGEEATNYIIRHSQFSSTSFTATYLIPTSPTMSTSSSTPAQDVLAPLAQVLVSKPQTVKSGAPQTVKSGEKARACTVKSTAQALAAIGKASAQTANDCIRRDGRKTDMLDVLRDVLTQKANDAHALGVGKIEKAQEKFDAKKAAAAEKKAKGLDVQALK